jgi:uncharacterized protein (DUF3084 family)
MHLPPVSCGRQEPEMRQKYLQMKDLDEHLLKQLENAQQEIDHLAAKKRDLEEELSISPVKQEAGVFMGSEKQKSCCLIAGFDCPGQVDDPY